MNVAVILVNMGGPDSLEAVEPYLFRIFKDPDIIDIPLPQFLRIPLVRFLARKRAPESQKIYQKIGGKSPLLDITKKQAQALQKELKQQNIHQFQVYTAMRYWHPLLEDVWQTVHQKNYDQIVVLSLYPFFSTTTSGSIINEVRRLKEKFKTKAEVLLVERFGAHPLFIESMVTHLKQHLPAKAENDDPLHILFSAHSIPLKRVQRGDPYFDEVKQALELLRKYFPEEQVKFHLAFQSKVGPIAWLSPATPEKIEELASQGVKKLYVFPLGFVAENSETLFEIGMLYRDLALQKGIQQFVRIEALNTQPQFIKALTQIVIEKINGVA